MLCARAVHLQSREFDADYADEHTLLCVNGDGQVVVNVREVRGVRIVLNCRLQVLEREAVPEPDVSSESTPTGGWSQMNEASIFTEI